MYRKLRWLVAMSIVQGGSGIQSLCSSVFDYISDTPESDNIIADINEVPD